jgi:hypothetical protein
VEGHEAAEVALSLVGARFAKKPRLIRASPKKGPGADSYEQQ